MLGKTIIFIGLLLVAIGVISMFGDRIPYLGKLPGDIYFKKDSVTIFFPLTTSILLSIILSFIVYLITRR